MITDSDQIKTVAVSGGFDPVHVGHIRMFKEAKELGDKLTVILNNDNWLKKKKGSAFMPEEERGEILKSIRYVDEVILTNHPENPEDMSVCESLAKIKPDIFANGGDRKEDNIPEYKLCEELGIKMIFNVGGGKIQSSSWLTSEKKKIIADPKIFKAYDIRGEWNKDWNGEFAYKIGKAIAYQLKPKTVAIGYDMRSSSPEIFEQLCKALIEQGIDIKDLGLCGTELTYFATSFVPEIDLAIMITASHNPGKDNGLKITSRNSVSLGLDSGLDKIRDLAFSELPDNIKEKGTISKLNLWDEYKEHVFKLAKINMSIPKKKIVVDAGNGVGGYMFDKVLGSLGLEVVRMFWTPDGNFPNHPADPLHEDNVKELKRKVVEEKAELGIAYDGDSDRVFFVDEKGRYLPGYYFAALMTDYILKQNRESEKEIIAHDPRYCWATKDVINKHGASSVKSKAGHTLIKAKMREVNSLFSAECSGHVFYRENNFAESSMLTTLLVVKLISEQGPLSQLTDNLFDNYPISGEINFIVDDPQEILLKLEEKYVEGEISKLDGIGIDFPEWRFNVRSSNTQPLLRLNIEAKSKELVAQKIEEMKRIIGGRIAVH